MANNTQPAFRAFTVVKREGQDDFWLAIGAAFEHSDQKGLNIVLQALPIDGKIVLRRPQDDEQSATAGSPRVVARADRQKGSSARRGQG